MENYAKFTIYYEPPTHIREFLKSVTFTVSRLNTNDNTYKIKLLQEHHSKTRENIEEYKMREIHIGAKEILDKINKIDFSKEYTPAIRNGMNDYFFICYGNKKIETSDKESIQYILDMFRFDELICITHKHYVYIKDMYEYLNLFNILSSKIGSLTGEQLATLSKLFKPSNPYLIFQSMAWLPIYLDEKYFPDD